MFSAYAPKVIAQQSSADWPMFLNDSAHTGATTNTGPTKPVKLWSYVEGHFDGSAIGSSAAIVNGVVYVGTNWNNSLYPLYNNGNSGNIYAFNAYTGAKIWNYSTDSAVYSSPAVSGNMLFIGVDDNVCAFNASTGVKIWSYATGGQINSSPDVVNGVVYIGSKDNNAYALNASTGAKIWNYTTRGAVESSPAVVNEVVYVGSDDGNVYALNALTGAKIWNYTTSNQPLWSFSNQVTSSPAVSGGIVYVGSVGGNVYALNASTGAKIWNCFTNPSSFDGGGYLHGVQASPTVTNGVVYVGTVDGNMYALNASTGKQIWEDNIFRVLSSAAVTDGVMMMFMPLTPQQGPKYGIFLLKIR
jgi:outer membrane protein assembly factor BamB